MPRGNLEGQQEARDEGSDKRICEADVAESSFKRSKERYYNVISIKFFFFAVASPVNLISKKCCMPVQIELS